MIDIFNLRKEFTLKTLNETDVNRNPLAQFEIWFKEALEAVVTEPNAMVLSTATTDGKPSSRVVLLKQIQNNGLVFFTNYESRKGIQLKENPYCALNFVWHELERQVRIEGIAERLSSAESDNYFEVRPIGSKLGAWASPQSMIIENHEYLEKMVEDYKIKFEKKEITRPPNWGGFIVKPYLFEFWQGRENRLHDRIEYQKGSNLWTIKRLAP